VPISQPLPHPPPVGDHRSAQTTLVRSLRPVRIVLSLAFLAVVILSPGEQVADLGTKVSLLLAATAGGNAIANLTGILGWTREVSGGRAFALQMATDTLLALAGMLMLDAAATPLAWVALLLPVFDAGVVFGPIAAGITWGSLSLFYVVLKLQFEPTGDGGADVLRLAVQQLAAVAVVALPAMHVATRLRDDLSHSHGARVEADDRSAELLHVADAAQQLARARDGGTVLEIALSCATALGFPSVDVCERHGDRPWQLLRAAGALRGPEPNRDHRLDAAATTGAIVRCDPGDEDTELRLLGFRACAVLPISNDPAYGVALRAWSTRPLEAESSVVEALELLGRLSSGSWQSTKTLANLESWSMTLAHQALHDELTGLANRAHLIDRLDRSLARVTSTGGRCSVLFLDLDGFKQVNDRLGHDAGDAVLQAVAARLGRQVRGHDLVARLGGDEFVVVVDEPAGPDEVAAIAERLCEAVGAPLAIGAATTQLGVSVGIAHASPGDTAERLLTTADGLMYEAKRGGGGRFVAERPETRSR
jgi:diguanylate cyclase (GGDEF)-like protein